MPNGNQLPVKIDPFRLAEQSGSLSGVLQIKDMQRLSTSLSSVEGSVNVDLNFGIDKHEGVRFLRSHIQTQMMLQCQRCLESFSYKIDNDSLLGLITTEEEAESLPERYDPVLAASGVLMIQDMVEDELILSLPIIPMHEPKDCKVKLPSIVAETEQTAIEKENPFKVIESLKRKTD